MGFGANGIVERIHKFGIKLSGAIVLNGRLNMEEWNDGINIVRQIINKLKVVEVGEEVGI